VNELTPILREFWSAVVAHSWQTALVLVPLFLLGRAARPGPGAGQRILWSAGLLKFFLPLAVGGGLAARALGALWYGDGGEAPVILEKAAVLLDPAAKLNRAATVSGAWGGWALAALTLLWGGGALFILGRIVRDVRGARRHGGRPALAAPLDGEECAKLERALAASRITADRVLVSKDAILPAVVGFLKPRILLPLRAVHALPADELHAVLVHEEVHRTRRDPLLLLVQRIATALFFFHPLLRPLLRELRQAQELACDDDALRAGVKPEVLSRAIARTLRLGLEPLALSAAVGGTLHGEPSLLRRRFDHLSASQEVALMRRVRLLVVAAFAILVVGTFLPLPDGGAVAQAGPGGEVAKQPVPVKTVTPEYPEEAARAGIEGEALVRVLVNTKGYVESATVEKCTPPDHPEFGEAGVVAAKAWVFKAAEDSDGNPVPAYGLIPFRFALDDKNREKADAK
jgi:TonB family protein